MGGNLLKARLHVLSPIHIGCDDVYDPTGFVIDKENKKLIAFDPVYFIKSLSATEKQEIINISMEGNAKSILKVYNFIYNKLNKIKTGNVRNVEISNGIVAHYKSVLNLLSNRNEVKKIENEINQFIINRTAYNSNNNLPYIPGSSLKGSFRTGYLNMAFKNEANNFAGWIMEAKSIEETNKKKWKEFSGKNKDLEMKLLGGSFDSDPFSMIKVSDFIPMENVKTKILYSIIRKKKNSPHTPRGPHQIFEIIKENSVFEGVINISEPQRDSKIKKPIHYEKLLEAMNNFYKKEFETENKEIIAKINANSGSYNAYINKYKGKFKLGCFVRIGRHSGAKAITIDDVRKIKIMQKQSEPDKYLDNSSAIWLASEEKEPRDNHGLLPFGWAILEILTS